MHRIVGITMLGALGTVVASGQPALRLKTRAPTGDGVLAASQQPGFKHLTPGRLHQVIQFADEPSEQDMADLVSQGAVILQYVPDHAVLVSGPEQLAPASVQVVRAEALKAIDKLSPELAAAPEIAELTKDGEAPQRLVIVEFYPDVEVGDARQIASIEGVTLVEHADLVAGHLLVQGSAMQLAGLADWDEVAYVYPASEELANASPVHACAGALTQWGVVGQYIASVGEGWDGPGLNSARLKYVISAIPAKLPADAARSEILRALAEWSRVVKVDFVAGASSRETRAINVLFASGAHGDPYPFDGPGRVLAHTFYPAPPNPEPLAGDLHLDESESWRIGNDVDLYSVVLHELGHALGLGHSDKPGAVMYPYYGRASSLTDEDIGAIGTLYATREPVPANEPPPATPTPAPPAAPAPTPSAPPPTATPDKTNPAIAIQSPQATSLLTSAASITLKGSASDNVGVTRINWSSNVYGLGLANGTTQWSAAIPLAVGMNTLIVRAYDAAGNSSWRSVVITRK